MAFVSLTFVLFSLAAIVLLRLAPLGRVRDGLLLGLNAVFLASFVTSPVQLAGLFGFVLLGYGAAFAVSRNDSGRLLGLMVAALVLVFVWLKQYPPARIAPLPSALLVVVGLSYLLFRILHIVVDVSQRSLTLPGPLAYLNYVFFFPSFVSGPIQRFEAFQADAAARSPLTGADLHKALNRIVLGLVLVAVISALASKFVDSARAPWLAALREGPGGRAIGLYLAILLAYLVNLYANFAGYMHIVIGVAALAGYTVPENFNQPLRSKNFLDFWTRWHMTLGAWFRTYLFNPLLKALTPRWPSRQAAPYLAAAAFFVTFFVMGLWHGATFPFVVYGLFLAFGISVNRLWQAWAVKWWGRDGYRRLCDAAWYRQLSRAAALSYFIVALTCLWIDRDLARLVFAPLGAGLALAAFVILTLGGAVAGAVWDAVEARVAARDDAPARGPAGLMLAVVAPVGGLFLAVVLAEAAFLGAFSLDAAGLTLVMKSALVTAAMAVIIGVTAGLTDPPLRRLFARFGTPARAADATALWMGVRLFLLVGLLLLFAGEAPRFVYQEF